ncbi:hypothetical protein FRB99_007031 [Tulasnella sp. 403]|nr:hypothetical protein FRB99_007031 [Tulasnella sp. 403]
MPVIKYDILNTFTSVPFAGNQCAVVILTAENAVLPDEMLQKIAAEFSLPMTCVLYPLSSDSDTLRYRIRWFTTTIETPLCGHAVLAATHILLPAAAGHEMNVVNFESLWGPLSATKMVDGKIGLEFPAPAAKAVSEENMVKTKEVLNEALGRTVDITGVQDGP